MLCIIALSCFFWRIFFASCGWIETVALKKHHCERRVDCKKCDRKKQQKGGLCGSPKKDCASHEERMVRIFWGWGRCSAELPVIIFQACLTAFYVHLEACSLAMNSYKH